MLNLEIRYDVESCVEDGTVIAYVVRKNLEQIFARFNAPAEREVLEPVLDALAAHDVTISACECLDAHDLCGLRNADPARFPDMS